MNNHLWLRATLPPKPSSRKTAPYQQRLATKLPANPAGIREAEKRARLPNEAIGHSVTKYLSPKLSFTPYDLRHAWAVRTLLYRWPVELSARQMGHSVEVHTRTYQRWISAQQIQGVYDLLVNRPDRPRPPRVSDQPFQSG
jgi:integrase